MFQRSLSGIPGIHVSPVNILPYPPLHSHLSTHSFMFNSESPPSDLSFITTHCLFYVIVQFDGSAVSAAEWSLSYPCLFVDVKYEKPEVFV